MAGKVQLTLRTAVHPGVCGSVQFGDEWLPQVSEGPLSQRVRGPSGPVQSAFFVAVLPVLPPWFLEKGT